MLPRDVYAPVDGPVGCAWAYMDGLNEKGEKKTGEKCDGKANCNVGRQYEMGQERAPALKERGKKGKKTGSSESACASPFITTL